MMVINSPHSPNLCVCWYVHNLNISHLVLCVAPKAPATQDNADSLVDDFVVTESASVVEDAIAESAAVQAVRTTQEEFVTTHCS